MLRFGNASSELRQIVGEFGDWMSNGRPCWAAYRALTLGRLISLDKCLGVRPVRLGETWQRLLSKCVVLYYL